MRSALAIVLWFGLLGMPYCADAAQTYRPPDCGMNALYLLFRSMGEPTGLGEIEQALPERLEDGYLMAELADASRALGRPLRGLQIQPEDLPLDRPAIAYLIVSGRGHFVVLNPVGQTGTMVQVLDPPNPPTVVDYDRLLSGPAWTGLLLIPPSKVATRMRIGAALLIALAVLALVGSPPTRRFAKRLSDRLFKRSVERPSTS